MPRGPANRASPRVLILTADIGEGHDLPARMIAADLEKEVPDAEVTIDNGLEAMGRMMSAVVLAAARVSPSAARPGSSTSSTG